MISVRPKIKELSFHLFAKSVHPELFARWAHREFERENYRLRISITTTGHLITFQNAGHVLTEVSAAANHPLPTREILLSRDLETACNEQLTFRDAIRYNCQTQLEGVNPKTFVTIGQQLDEQVSCEGLLHRFQPGGRSAFGAVSYINVQSFHAHVQVRTFHTFPDTCAVLKSESKFVVLNPVPLTQPS